MVRRPHNALERSLGENVETNAREACLLSTLQTELRARSSSTTAPAAPHSCLRSSPRAARQDVADGGARVIPAFERRRRDPKPPLGALLLFQIIAHHAP